MKYILKTSKVLLLTLLLIIFQLLLPSPWWLFLILPFLVCSLMPKTFWYKNTFFIGFTAGFLSWILPTIYFGVIYNGDAASILTELISVPYPFIVLAIGCLGGVLVGLSSVAGVQLRQGKEEIKLEL